MLCLPKTAARLLLHAHDHHQVTTLAQQAWRSTTQRGGAFLVEPEDRGDRVALQDRALDPHLLLRQDDRWQDGAALVGGAAGADGASQVDRLDVDACESDDARVEGHGLDTPTMVRDDPGIDDTGVRGSERADFGVL